MHQSRITKIEWARLEGLRPRKAGCNARLGDHGQRVATPITRITTDDGSTGFGWSRLGFEQAQALLDTTLADALMAGTGDGIAGVAEPYRAIEYPLLDLAAKRAGKPVYALVGDQSAGGAPLQVPCYDTSLYMDEFHLTDDTEAVDCIAGEASQGLARGHRHFKIKVGRGAMHMPLEAGTVRDIAVIHAVRAVAGPDARLMIDANNGYNLNLTKRVLAETAGANVYWMEEPFHEDPQLYGHLKEWLAEKGMRDAHRRRRGRCLRTPARLGRAGPHRRRPVRRATPRLQPLARARPACSMRGAHTPRRTTTASRMATTSRATSPPPSATSRWWSGTRRS